MSAEISQGTSQFPSKIFLMINEFVSTIRGKRLWLKQYNKPYLNPLTLASNTEQNSNLLALA